MNIYCASCRAKKEIISEEEVYLTKRHIVSLRVDAQVAAEKSIRL